MVYWLSLHYTPLIVGTLTTTALWSLGRILPGVVSVATTAAVTLTVFWAQPLTFSTPRGRFAVGLKELCRDEVRGIPPVSLFYPIEDNNEVRTCSWLPFGDRRYLKGLAKYSGFPYVLFRDLRQVVFPIPVDGKLPPLLLRNGAPREIYILSHGICGYSRLYTSLIQELVSRGAIVCALTHTDESAAFCRDESNSFAIFIDTALKFTKEDRRRQILQRISEIRNIFDEITSGAFLLSSVGYSVEEIQAYNDTGAPIHLIGHSFGGSTVLKAVSTGKLNKQRIGGVVALDPWHVPLQGVSGFTDGTFPSPSLLLFSEEWAKMDGALPFFNDFQDSTGKVHIQVFPGTDHMSFCDIALFSRVGRKSYCVVNPFHQIRHWAEIISDFTRSLCT